MACHGLEHVVWSEALSSYAHALELDPSNADAYVARGAAYANTEKYDEALLDFERALKHEPGHLNAPSAIWRRQERRRGSRGEPPKSPRRVPPQAACRHRPRRWCRLRLLLSTQWLQRRRRVRRRVRRRRMAAARRRRRACSSGRRGGAGGAAARSASEKKRKHHREAEEEDGSTRARSIRVA